MNLLFILLQTGNAAANAANQTGELRMNYWDLTVKGGWIMIPLAIMSVIAVYIFIERYLAIKRASKEDENFMNRIREYIHEDKIESALAMCKSKNTPVARMIEKGLQRLGRPLSDVNTAIENVGNLEVSKLEDTLPWLATIAGGAPMLGFLGTVLGMVRAFYDMSMSGNDISMNLLSNGIYTAMITTVGGLIVGIFAYLAYNYLVARIDKVVFTLEAHTTEFMDLLNEPVA